MAVKLRLTRRGRKNSPFYRVVAADGRAPRDGRFIEVLGVYHPLKKSESEQIDIDEEMALKWLNRGAIPTDVVRSLLRKQGIMKKYHESKAAAKKARQEAKG